MRRTHDQGGVGGRSRAGLNAALAALALLAVLAVLAAGCTSQAHATPRADAARFEIAPVTRVTNPPCHAPQVYSGMEQKCLTLSAAIARTTDVVDATVMYDSSQASWFVAVTLDAAANARIAARSQSASASPQFAEIATLVDARVVQVSPLVASGQSLLIASTNRADAIARAQRITGRTPTVQGGPHDAELTLGDHWHVALGVDDCGAWVPNWSWAPGNVTNGSAVGAGAPARAGSNGQVYAGLHSHGDGLIHLEPSTTQETGAHATLGLYFRYGGWQVSEGAIDFVNVHEQNGNSCDGKPGVLRWSVNGVEQHGDPASYRLHDGDTIALVFDTADTALPPKSAVPSYATLRQILGLAP